MKCTGSDHREMSGNEITGPCQGVVVVGLLHGPLNYPQPLNNLVHNHPLASQQIHINHSACHPPFSLFFKDFFLDFCSSGVTIPLRLSGCGGGSGGMGRRGEEERRGSQVDPHTLPSSTLMWNGILPCTFRCLLRPDVHLTTSSLLVTQCSTRGEREGG